MSCPAATHFRAFQAEVTEAFETKSDPGAFWAKWIDVVVEGRQQAESDGPNARG